MPAVPDGNHRTVGDRPGGHDVGERLYVTGDSIVHRLPAHVKLLSAVTTILVVVLTPAQWWPAFLGYFALVTGVVAVARIPLRAVLARMTVELPFVVFAVLLPVVGRDPRIPVGPVELSEPGLWAMWNILAKATIGVAISITLAATTPARDLVGGLRRLHAPDLLVQILAAMVRYVHVVTAEYQRMAQARAARGFRARSPRSWPVLAQSMGALFIRSYERGERVHAAMLSRGYTGRMPDLGGPAPAVPVWPAAVLPAAAVVVCCVTWLVVS